MIEDLEKSGGPAFPFYWKEKQLKPYPDTEYFYPGMSLRDYFAALAMQAHLSPLEAIANPEIIAKSAYVYADAMLKARGKQ